MTPCCHSPTGTAPVYRLIGWGRFPCIFGGA